MAGEPTQSADKHTVPGERLSRRLTSRSVRRPRMGMSPAFYLRFGMEDPWVGGMPTGPVGADHDDAFGFTYVSRRAHDQHLLRLAWARRRRDERMDRLTKRYGAVRLKAAGRRWPGESKRRRFSFGLVSVSDSDMILPPAPIVQDEEELDESGVPVVSAFGGRKETRGGRAKPQAWFTREHTPAKVFKTPRSPLSVSRPAPQVVVVEKEIPASAQVARELRRSPVTAAAAPKQRRPRALDQAGARLAHTVQARHPVARELERLAQTATSPRVRAEARRVVEQVVDLPATEQIKVVRRVLRSMGPAARVVRTEVVRGVEDAQMAPASLAAERAVSTRRAGGRRRGLRPVMSSSPMVSRLAPELPSAAPTTRAVGQAPQEVASGRSLRSSVAGRAALRTAPVREDRLLPAPVSSDLNASQVAPQLSRSPVARQPLARSMSEKSGAPEQSAIPGKTRGTSTSQVAARLARTDDTLADLIEDAEEHESVVHRPAGRTLGLRRHSVVRTARGAYMPAATVVQHELAAAADADVEAEGQTRSGGSPGARVVQGLGTHGSTRREQERVALETVARELFSKVGIPRDLRQQLGRTSATSVAEERSTARSPEAAPAPSRVAASAVPAAQRDVASRRPRVAARGPMQAHSGARPSSSPASHAAARVAVGQSRPGSLSPVVSVAQSLGPSGPLARLSAPVARSVRRVARTAADVGTIASVVAAVHQADSAEHAERLMRRLPPVVRAAVRSEAGAARTDSVVPSAIPRRSSLSAVAPREAASGTPVASHQAVARVAQAAAPTLRSRTMRAFAPMAQLARTEGVLEAEEGASTESSGPTRTHGGTRTPGGTRVIQHQNVQGVASTTRSFVTQRRADGTAVVRPVRVERERRASVAPMVAASTRDSMAPTVVNTVVRVLVDGLDIPESIARQVVRKTRPSPVSYARSAPASALGVDLRPLTRLLEEENRKVSASSSRTGSGRRMRTWAPNDTVLEQDAPVAGEAGASETSGARVIRGMAGDKRPLPKSTTRVVRGGQSASASGRPLDWMGDRAKVNTVAARRRPSFTEGGERSSTGQIMARAGSHKTPTNKWLARDMVKSSDGRFQSARRIRPSRSAVDSNDLVVPEAAAAPSVESSLEALSEATPRELQTQLAALPPQTRTHLAETLGAVGKGQSGGDLPGWASRANGLPNVHGDGGQLLTALARASEVDEIVRVIVESGSSLKTVRSSLPKPVIQVIEQIRSEASQPGDEGQSAPQDLSRGISKSAFRQASRSSSQVIKGFKSLRPTASGGTASSGASANQLSKLSKRLKELIHLAEGGQQGEARRQVRMAEDSAAAQQEGQAAPNSADTVAGQQVDVEALGREVLEVVSRELEMRRERRMGESDDFWW